MFNINITFILSSYHLKSKLMSFVYSHPFIVYTHHISHIIRRVIEAVIINCYIYIYTLHLSNESHPVLSCYMFLNFWTCHETTGRGSYYARRSSGCKFKVKCVSIFLFSTNNVNHFIETYRSNLGRGLVLTLHYVFVL